MANNEHQFESDIEALMTGELGWSKARKLGAAAPSTEHSEKALDLATLVKFVKASQPREWAFFVKACSGLDPEREFYKKFEDAVATEGMIDVLRNGFYANGKHFSICYFKPENRLNETALANYEKNICEFHRQWHYSASETAKSVDVMLSVNGIPLVAIELKDQFTGQTVENAKVQWMTDRNPKEGAFRLNHRVLVFFAVDLNEAWMTTQLAGEETRFLPFNQGSAGAGEDGGAGNPPWNLALPRQAQDRPFRAQHLGPQAPTDYLWRDVLAKDSLLDILQKFVNYEAKEKRLVFPRFHQLDVVRKLINDVKAHGSGKNYLVQHSAGSGKSNSIAWIGYRLASLFNDEDKPVFNSVIIVTDRRVLDKQLQNTVMSFNPKLGEVAVIDEKKHAKDLLAAIDDGKRIIVSTLQKFPVIFKDVKSVEGKRFAIVVDEAHSSQTGQSAAKLKIALADLREAVAEYEAETGKKIDKDDLDSPETQLALMMCTHGKHRNLSYFAFTATPKDVTLDIFGTRQRNGSFRPFHTYSMRQAIEEGFIHDVLANYTTYKTCYEIVKATADNPEVPVSEAAKTIKKYKNLHPKNFAEKSAVIVDTFLSVTRRKFKGAKMMVVTDSRRAAVRYFFALQEALKDRGQEAVKVMVAFSGQIEDPPKSGTIHTEESLNAVSVGKTVKESQTKAVFHKEGDILVVAEKYQTGFDEPLLHTMIVDKKLRDVKAVQTLSRVNRIYPGKTDTYILDFVNTDAEIKEAFQPYYQETGLAEEINIDLVFKKRKEIRKVNLYSEADIEAVNKIHFAGGGKKNASVQGQIAGALTPVVGKYNALTAKERSLYRRNVRSFVRWYNYLTQITRLFDDEIQKEHTFLTYLEHLLPPDAHEVVDLEGAVKLKYYKLKETFSGAIELEKKPSIFDAPKPKPATVMTQARSLLQEVINAINEAYAGDFTDSDLVIVEMVLPKVLSSAKLKKAATANERNVYIEGIFPGVLDQIVLDAYRENDKAFDALLNDKAKYLAFLKALADISYVEFKKKRMESKKWDGWGDVVSDVAEDLRFREYLPLYSLRAACGVLGDGEIIEPEGWVKADGVGKLDKTMVVVHAEGDSMEPTIHGGDLCVVRKIGGGNYEDQIVLVQRNDKAADPESGGAYLLKKLVKKGGKTLLRSINREYPDIPIDNDDDITIVASLHKVLHR